ncbi:MAG: agmatine deiminase family protein [Gemmatimonadales bacterium]
MSVPAEWAPHRAMWLGFPSHLELWLDDLAAAQVQVAQLARKLADPGRERVKLLACGEDGLRAAEILCGGVAGIEIIAARFGDIWLRDTGPIFTGPGRAAAFAFNGWGGKYRLAGDAAVAGEIAGLAGAAVDRHGFVLEGGAVDHDGEGTALTTRQCLLNPNRNPHLDRGQIEEYLRGYLGVSNILWLGDGIVGDDTDGHVDDITRFVSGDTVVTAVENDPDDENYEPLQANLERLGDMTDQDGRPLRIVTLPMPRPLYQDGQRLPASYANFYIANGVVMLPTYDPERDEEAAATLQDLFTDREIIGVDCTDLVWGLGAFHCVTQQWPA